MEVHTRPDGLVVVNDAYNANPASMRAAIDAVAQMGEHRSGRTVAVLGEMLELGEGGAEAHREVGRHAAEAGVDRLVVVGEGAAALAEGARGVTGWTGQAVVTADREEALALLRASLASDDVVLVKASRGAALEVVAEGLLGGGSAPG
jgi:UDP-N-acetylmuramoyl-tripeptide--D-alanyl-D-alanine ligase